MDPPSVDNEMQVSDQVRGNSNTKVRAMLFNNEIDMITSVRRCNTVSGLTNIIPIQCLEHICAYKNRCVGDLITG